MPKRTTKANTLPVAKKYKPLKYKTEYEVFCKAMHDLGPWNVSDRKFANEYNVPERTVGRWKAQWIKNFSSTVLKESANEAGMHCVSAFKILTQGLTSGDQKTRTKAAKDVIDYGEKLIRSLQAFGHKVGVEDILSQETQNKLEIEIIESKHSRPEAIDAEFKEA